MSENKRTFSTYTVVMVGVMAALVIILTRVLAISLPFARFTFGSAATVLCGLWFGPVAGGLCGLIADIVGALMQGYAINPFITVAAVLWGVIPALVFPRVNGSKTKRIIGLCVSIVVTSIICTLGFTYAGLVLMLGYDFYAILPTRLGQFAIMTPAYCVVVAILYYSPLTSMLKGTRTPARA